MTEYDPLEELLEEKDLTDTEKLFLGKLIAKLVKLDITTNDYPYYEGRLFGLRGVTKNTARVWCRILEGKGLVYFYEQKYFTQPIVNLHNDLYLALNLHL